MQIQSQIVHGATTLYGQVIARMARVLAAPTASPEPSALVEAECDPAAAALFAAAVEANSNLELDWLWLATRVSGSAERRYCMQKVLAINPDHDDARRALGLPRRRRRG